MNERLLSDDALLNELAALAGRFDPVPIEVVMDAQASFASGSAWDNALAALIYDSTTDEDDARALVRAGTGARELTFEAPQLTVEVEIGPADSPRAGLCQIFGQLVPPVAATVEVRRAGSSVITQADEFGRFSIEDAQSGPMSLRCTPVDATPTDTEWILI